MKKFLVLCAAVVGVGGMAHADFIDLNDFWADGTVSVSSDGYSASFTESTIHMESMLSNDPGLGDPEVIFAGVNVTLQFDYEFLLGADDEGDEFGAWVIDGGTGDTAGADYEFFTQDSSSGTIAFDLSGLTSLDSLGLQFQLSSSLSGPAYDVYGSTLQISNLRLVTDTPDSIIPEPATVFLLGAGLLGYAARRRQQA